MLAPRIRKLLAICITLFTACFLSSGIFIYLFLLSPNARALRQERSADIQYKTAQEIVSTMSTLAEIEDRQQGLKKAIEYKKTEGEKAYNEAKSAQEKYYSLKESKIKKEVLFRINKKIESTKYLIKGAKSYKGWINEASKGVKVIKYTKESFKWQTKGINSLNQAVTQINAADTNKALKLSEKTIDELLKAKTAISKAQKSFSNQDISQLKIMIDKYMQAANIVQKMTRLSKDDTDAYNKEVDSLNNKINEGARIASKNPISKDLNDWLENNFYYDGGQLIFNYKRSAELWPNL